MAKPNEGYMPLDRRTLLRSASLTLCALPIYACSSTDAQREIEPPEETQADEPSAETNEAQAEANHDVVPMVDLRADELPRVVREAEGRVVVLNIWSTWCPPCMAEMPMLVDEIRGQRDVSLVLVSMDMGTTRRRAAEFLAEHGAPTPRYIRAGRDNEFMEAVHDEWSGALPATVIFGPGPERQPLELLTGELTRERLRAALDRALA